jgi:hypothetical protein
MHLGLDIYQSLFYITIIICFFRLLLHLASWGQLGKKRADVELTNGSCQIK